MQKPLDLDGKRGPYMMKRWLWFLWTIRLLDLCFKKATKPTDYWRLKRDTTHWRLEEIEEIVNVYHLTTIVGSGIPKKQKWDLRVSIHCRWWSLNPAVFPNTAMDNPQVLPPKVIDRWIFQYRALFHLVQYSWGGSQKRIEKKKCCQAIWEDPGEVKYTHIPRFQIYI